MNWSKNLYVFMLGALIVFSGCLGNGTNDEEDNVDTTGTTIINNYYNNTTIEEDTAGTTVINNFYNNTTTENNTSGTTADNSYYNNTTTEIITEIPELIAIGGEKGDDLNLWDVYSFTTVSGELVQIHEARFFYYNGGMQISTHCAGTNYTEITVVEGIGSWYVGQNNGFGPGPYYLPFSFIDCTHTVQLSGGTYDETWSFVYSIVPVTVG